MNDNLDKKKIERYEATIDSYLTFVDSFEKSSFLKTAESYYNSSLREIEKQNNLN